MRAIWKVLVNTIAGSLAVLLIIIALEVIASESGEVVVVTTVDTNGAPQTTRLWVVEHSEDTYLRTGSPQSGWFRRMQSNPQVQIERNGGTYTARIVPVVSMRDTINDAMNEKYGWADDYIGMLFGRNDSIPLRVDPI